MRIFSRFFAENLKDAFGIKLMKPGGRGASVELRESTASASFLGQTRGLFIPVH